MVLVLVIGDMFIPQLSANIPEPLSKLLVSGKIQHILCTGNITGKLTMDYLKSICNKVHCVKGEFDRMKNLKTFLKLDIENFTVGLCSGYEFTPQDCELTCGAFARKHHLDILIHGGGNHKLSVKDIANLLIINPGSGTGCSSLDGDNLALSTASFVIVDIHNNSATVYSYELDMIDPPASNVRVNKHEHSKTTISNVSE